MMKAKFKLIFLLIGLTAILSSCRTFGLPGIGAGFHLIGRRHQP